MVRINRKTVLLIIMVALMIKAAGAESESRVKSRFFYGGDGYIRITGEKSGASFEGRYRQRLGLYDEQAYRSLCRVFGAAYSPKHLYLSMRLIEFLDFLQDQFGSEATMTIISGYRSPTYNTHLRNQGALAAKASLHQYGMAADLRMTGVASRKIRDYIKGLGFGGVGYYHGDTVHIDVGPARSWDEKSSGVGTGISDDNKLIGLITDYDRYQPGDRVLLRFIRMTAFPIGVVPEFELLLQDEKRSKADTIVFRPSFNAVVDAKCPQFTDIGQMAGIEWHLPDNLSGGRYIIHAEFCNDAWNGMPSDISTSEIEVIRTIDSRVPLIRVN